MTANLNFCHLHDAVFEQVRLQCAIKIHDHIIPDLDQIEFGHLGGVEIHTTPNSGTQQPEKPANIGLPR